MNWTEIFRSGISTGTVLLIAAIGEILTERSGIQNLGVEGMMLLGAMAGFRVAFNSGNVWLGLLAAIAAGGLLSLAHAVVTIHFQADQPSAVSLTRAPAWRWFGRANWSDRPVIPHATFLCFSGSISRSVAFTDQACGYFGYLLVPVVGISLTKPVGLIPALWARTLLLLTRWASISTAPATFIPSSGMFCRTG